MASLHNGVLYVEAFSATGTPGEYLFENAVFNTQNDTTGAGALEITNDYVLFTPVIDPNTFLPIPGTVNRYKLTNLIHIDTGLISGTIVWDEQGEELNPPGYNVFCIISKVTPNKRLAVPAIDVLYSDLLPGGTIAAMLNDLVNILDRDGGGFNTPVPDPVDLAVVEDFQSVFTLPYKPIRNEITLLIVNGLLYRYGIDNDYHIIDDSLFWHNSEFALNTTDSVVFR